MGEYLGMFKLDGVSADQLLIHVRTTNSSGVLVEADATPTYKIFQPGNPPTVMTSGTGTLSLRHSGVITGTANNGGLVRITSAAHGLQTNDRVIQASVGGTTEANGTFSVTYVDANTYDLQGSTYANAYTSGGTWTLLGLYSQLHSLASGATYERGKNYFVEVTYVSTSTFPVTLTFTVV